MLTATFVRFVVEVNECIGFGNCIIVSGIATLADRYCFVMQLALFISTKKLTVEITTVADDFTSEH